MSKDNSDVNPICRECIKFESFGKGCWVYWEGKKFCTMRATTKDELEERARIVG